MSLSKHNEKMKLFRILFTLLRNVLLEMQSKILLYTKKHFPVKKCIVLLDWLYKCFINSSKAESRKYLTNNPELLKSEKYILRGILFWLASWFFLTRFGTFNQQGSTHSITLCLQKSLRKLNLKLTLKQVNFQWHKC